MIKAFIFDFDGLIIDSEMACYQTWLEIYQRYQVDLPLSKWELVIGSSNHAFDPIAFLAETGKVEIDGEAILAEHANKYREKTKKLPVLPGVLHYLKWAKNNHIKTALASSSTHTWVISHLKDLGIDHLFDLIRTSEDVENVKPSPDLFLSVKSNLQLNDFEAVVFEDSLNGILAANASNFHTIAVPNDLTKKMDLSAANFILNTLNATEPQNLVKILETNLKNDSN